MSPILTLIGIIATLVSVVYLVIKPKGNRPRTGEIQDKYLLDVFKSNADRYDVDFDNCEFKDSSYISEVEEDNTDLKRLGLLVGSPVGYMHTPIVREENIQAVLFYSHPSILEGKRFFQTIPMELTTLKYHVLSGHVSLYVDKIDQTKYLFELKSE